MGLFTYPGPERKPEPDYGCVPERPKDAAVNRATKSAQVRILPHPRYEAPA